LSIPPLIILVLSFMAASRIGLLCTPKVWQHVF